MNLAELRAEVVRNTWRDDLEEDALDLHINEACRHAFTLREWWWREAIKTSVSSTDDRLDLPSNFSSPVSVSVITDGDGNQDGLVLTTIHKLRRAYSGSSTGEPCHYAISGNELFVGPRPDKSYAYELIYKIKNTTLSAPTDTNEAATHLGLAVAARAAATIAA
ncbi:MAG: hypothetical protein AB7P02_12645, partial [Alphaproteobacteria bacterium]